MGTSVELRIMPNGEDGGWYWEVVKDGRRQNASRLNVTFDKSIKSIKQSKEAEAHPQRLA